MSKVITTVASVFAAAAAPAVIVGLVMLLTEGLRAPQTLLSVLVIVFSVALAHAVVLGLPAVWLLRRIGRFRLWLTLCAGFLVGLAPVAISSWPYRASLHLASERVNGIETLKNGVPTLAGWISYVQSAAWVGVFGSLGALAFYLTFKGISSNISSKPKVLRGAR